MSTETKKSNLAKAFEKKNALNLNLTTDQFIALNDILCDLATQEFEKGLNKGMEIANMFNK
tara:strand:- start:2597 stop:2779 length:183 start_codon:yes stop_codon:yes gene_type:complete